MDRITFQDIVDFYQGDPDAIEKIRRNQKKQESPPKSKKRPPKKRQPPSSTPDITLPLPPISGPHDVDPDVIKPRPDGSPNQILPWLPPWTRGPSRPPIGPWPYLPPDMDNYRRRPPRPPSRPGGRWIFVPDGIQKYGTPPLKGQPYAEEL